jgi:RNA polymerase sigma factor (sigma-70 family)
VEIPETWLITSLVNRQLNMNTVNESILWRRFKEGDRQAFSQIYHTYFRDLYNYASKFTADKDLVKDCVHDLFVDLWEGRENLKDLLTIKYYLFRAFRNTMLDALAARKKIVLEDEGDLEKGFEFVLSHEARLIDLQWNEEQTARVLKALNTLSPRQKEAVFLRFYNNFSYEEIASVMSLQVDSVYNLISKALTILRKQITQFETAFSLSTCISMLLTLTMGAEWLLT